MTQRSFTLNLLATGCLLATSSMTLALEEMKETEMSQATGEGVAFIAENYSLVMGDTDYIKMTSTGGDVVPTGRKGEFYLYGLNIGGTTSAGPDYSRKVVPVDVGTANNPARIKFYESDYVPVFDANVNNGTANQGKQKIDVLEIAYPERELDSSGNPKVGSEENLKWSTWVDLLARDGAYTDTVVNGMNKNRTRALIMADKMSWNGSYIQQWKTANHPTNPAYSNKVAMSGFLRANTAKDGYLRISADTRTNPKPIEGAAIESVSSNARYGDAYVTTAPEFGADKPTDNQEGLYWKNFANNMPLGILGYQPSIVSSGGESGRELVVELARIPNNKAAYDAAYINYNDPADVKAKMCTPTSCPRTATHATLSFQLHTKQKDGSFFDKDPTTGAQLLDSNVAGRYFGLGLGANPTNPGSAGISVGTNGAAALQALEVQGIGAKANIATQGGAYSKFDGMFVQHLKITTKAFD